MFIHLRDMRVMLNVQIPGTEVRMPCVFCHFMTETADEFELSPQALMQGATRVDDVFVFSSATAPRVQYRVHCLGTLATPDKKSTLVTLFHVYKDIDRTLARQLFSEIKERGLWSLLVSYDDNENVVCLWVDTHGDIVERSLIKRDTLDFMSPIFVRLD